MGNSISDKRFEALLACAIDFSSFEDDRDEEVDRVETVSSDYGIDIETVNEMRSWWFLEQNELLDAFSDALIGYARDFRQDSDFVETVEAQFESDVFWADFVVLLSQHLFSDPVSEEDIFFSNVVDVNDVELDEATPMFVEFFQTDVPSRICSEFVSSKRARKALQQLGD